MSSLEEKKLLTDIKISILSIYEHLENNLEFEVYKSNKTIHSYDNVNDIVIWKIIIKDIPVLQKEINNYLEN